MQQWIHCSLHLRLLSLNHTEYGHFPLIWSRKPQLNASIVWQSWEVILETVKRNVENTRFKHKITNISINPPNPTKAHLRVIKDKKSLLSPTH